MTPRKPGAGRGPRPANKKLTVREAEFVRQYPIDLCAAAAYERAYGYQGKHARKLGFAVLQRPLVQEALRKVVEKRAAKSEISAERVLAEVARIAFSDIRNLFTWDEQSAAYVPSPNLTADQAAVISEVQAETRHTKAGDTKIKLSLKTYDKLGALSKLMQHLGMLKERVELSGKVEGTQAAFIVPGVMPMDEWKRHAIQVLGAQTEIKTVAMAGIERKVTGGNGNGTPPR